MKTGILNIVLKSLIIAFMISVVAINFHCGKSNEDSGVFKKEIFISGQDNYSTYRIPSRILTQNKTLLAFCEGRKNNPRDHGDVDLVIKSSTDNGNTWPAQSIVYEEGDTAKLGS